MKVRGTQRKRVGQWNAVKPCITAQPPLVFSFTWVISACLSCSSFSKVTAQLSFSPCDWLQSNNTFLSTFQPQEKKKINKKQRPEHNKRPSTSFVFRPTCWLEQSCAAEGQYWANVFVRERQWKGRVCVYEIVCACVFSVFLRGNCTGMSVPLQNLYRIEPPPTHPHNLKENNGLSSYAFVCTTLFPFPCCATRIGVFTSFRI